MTYEFFNVPASCEVKNTIFKKLFYENADLSPADKKLFTDNIKKVTWLYCLKQETINVKPYKDEIREYSEMQFMEIELEKEGRLDRIAEIIMRTIPYPMILTFNINDKLKFFVAHQRVNLNDRSKNTIESMISTDWLNSDSILFQKLDIQKMNFSNFYALYMDIVDAISVYNASSLIPDNNSLTGEEARKLTREIEELEKLIDNLKVRLKNESQFNKKIELNIEINKFKKRKSKITGGN